MAKDKTKVAIVILVINSLELIKSELQDLSNLETSGIQLECIIVDNGSTDGTDKFIKNYKLPNMSIKYIQTGSNLGFTGGNNVGIEYALENDFEYILLMNNDMIVPSDLLVKLVSFLKNKPNAGLVSPKIYFAKGYEFHGDRYKENEKGKVIWYAGGKIDWDNIYTSHIGVDDVDKGQYNKISKTEIANGACVLVRREVFEKNGLFDNGYFLYWEDADLSQRAIRSGFDCYYLPDAVIWHKVSVSAGGSGGFLNDYFLIRNRYFFALKYAKLRTKIAVIRDTIKIMFSGRKWQKKGALDALLGKKGVGSWH
ncbi:glycosyltransferase family 2 protein [Candidatus Dojkabacteria bacterium]|nr:glycosyltransferase family 2 protein [Candidatus Dojkabacteria bacterium]